MEDKNLYIIAGCNGAGKTTASFSILPSILECQEFVNADEIAKGISPFQPDKVAIEAGRIMLKRIDELLKNDESFAFETTLSTKSYKQKIELAKERVKIRVEEGGHNIPSEIIERRYKKGIINLFKIYLNIVDEVMIFDNSEGKHILLAEKNLGEDLQIYDLNKFNELKKHYDN
ncbi:MAG: zeta toxin [Sphingobacterium sp.]